MKNILHLTIIYLFTILVSCNEPANSYKELQMKTVEYVDINKFMGDWYVIANIPTFIEKGATNAIESYALDKDGNIATTFTFFRESSPDKIVKYTPKGFIVNKETNAEWRMQFLWPFKSKFLIIDLDEEYEITVIGHPSKKYVWVMARTPKIEDSKYSSIINYLLSIGYDISKIQKVPQEW